MVKNQCPIPMYDSVSLPDSPTQPQSEIDPLTVACIAVTAYLLAVPVIHEGISHGLTAVVLGACNVRVSASLLHFDQTSVSIVQFRIINIAGPVGSLIGGSLLVFYYRISQAQSAAVRYLLWLTAYVCLFQAGGYFMVLSFVNFGDINGFVTGLAAPFLWRSSFTLIGIVISFLALFAAGHDLDPFLGIHHRRIRAAKLVLISYFIGSGTLILSALLSPKAWLSTLLSAIPATLGGTVFLLYVILAVGRARSTTNPVPLTLARSPLSYVFGLTSLLIYAFALGPGVHLK